MLTEGVAAGHNGMIYFSDITFTKFCKDPSGKYLQAGNIWQYNQTTIFRSPSGMANGIKFDREGNMIAALGADYGGRMLVKTDMQTGKSYILTSLFNGRPYNALNDISGQVIVFFTLVVAAAEVAVGLAIIVAIFRRRQNVTADDVDLLKG